MEKSRQIDGRLKINKLWNWTFPIFSGEILQSEILCFPRFSRQIERTCQIPKQQKKIHTSIWRKKISANFLNDFAIISLRKNCQIEGIMWFHEFSGMWAYLRLLVMERVFGLFGQTFRLFHDHLKLNIFQQVSNIFWLRLYLNPFCHLTENSDFFVSSSKKLSKSAESRRDRILNSIQNCSDSIFEKTNDINISPINISIFDFTILLVS